MISIKEALIVEGKYDKIKLGGIIDGIIIVTNGFSIFKNEEMRGYIKRLAMTRGIVILTDSDRAGFIIRSHIKGFVDGRYIKNAYIPEIPGVEKRKTAASKSGLLGVEGMSAETIEQALLRAGCNTADGGKKEYITKNRLYNDGLFGAPDSKNMRRRFCEFLNLPQSISTNGFIQAINTFLDEQEYERILGIIKNEYVHC